MTKEAIHVGGQAVLEGVMMRSPLALAVAVRKADGQVAIKESAWKSLSTRFHFLTWPFIRGSVVLMEALINGIEALSFSANQALEDEGEDEIGYLAMGATIALSIVLGVLLFVVLPHYLSLVLGKLGPLKFGVTSVLFHAIDGVIKLALFLGYIWAISKIKEIGRLFEYHGAEHKSIYAFEAGDELTVENAQKYSTLHPRCGTAFIIVVLMISIILFTTVFPFVTAAIKDSGWAVHILYVIIKICLMLPIAGAAYELNKYASRHMDKTWLRWLILPGMWVQRITTREPSDDQVEVAIIALQKALAMEAERAMEAN